MVTPRVEEKDASVSNSTAAVFQKSFGNKMVQQQQRSMIHKPSPSVITSSALGHVSKSLSSPMGQAASCGAAIKNNDNSLMAISAGPGAANVMQVLERQMQMLQQQRQQDQANRLFAAMQQQQQERQQQKNLLAGATMSLLSVAQQEMRLLRIRQMMQSSQRQQQARQPTNNRASAA